MSDAFYDSAMRQFSEVQAQQYKKGLAKYNRPFHPRDWSGAQMTDHALQEAADLVVYLSGMSWEMERLQEQNYKLKRALSKMYDRALSDYPDKDIIQKIYKSTLS